MLIALAQIRSGPDPAANLELVRAACHRAAAHSAEIVLFPEATMRCFGGNLHEVAETVDGPWATEVEKIADAAGIAVVAGMFTPAAGRGKVRNTVIVRGRGLQVHYDKIHLFDAFGFAESKTVEAGSELTTFTLDGTVFGLATCYDIRFPGQFAALARAGAEIVLLGASWGDGPGKREQWDLLTRARALDATVFLAATGQALPAGANDPVGTPLGIGGSAIVSPRGQVIERLGSVEQLAIVDVDPGTVAETRREIPVLENARL